MLDTISASLFEADILNRYFRQLYASVVFPFYVLILNSCNDYMRRTGLNLETVSIIGVIIFNFEQVLDCEFFFLQVIANKLLKSIVSFENEVFTAHNSLYRIYSVITNLIQFLLGLLIPNY